MKNLIIDNGLSLDWGKSSQDYAQYRAGPPPSFYQKLFSLNIGIPDQRILDLGTGTGLLARQFAKQGAIVLATDISPEQIAQAKQLAHQEHLDIDFKVAHAHEIPYRKEFDAITANQCWLYFDRDRTFASVKEALQPEGVLMISSYHWLPDHPIVRATEKLILQFNPVWTGHSWDGVVIERPNWINRDFTVKHWFFYDEDLSFTREQWRGRIRANRAIGPTLIPEQVKAFDEQHDMLLRAIADEFFTIKHRIYARILMPS